MKSSNTSAAQHEPQARSLRVALVGDSLAYGAGDEARKGIALRLPDELEERGIENAETINLGINGARTGDLNSRLARPEIRANLREVDAIVLSIGANDLFATPGARENLLRSPLIVASQILERVATIVAELRTLNPKAKILIIGGYNPVPWHAQARQINEYLGLWDAALAGRFEDDRNIAIVRMSDLVDAQRLSRLDKFHPGGDAYQAVAERIADMLVG